MNRSLADRVALFSGCATRDRAPHRTREFTTSENAEIPPELDAKLKAFFDKMDADKNGEVSKEEAVAFWGKNFGLRTTRAGTTHSPARTL